MRRTCVIVPGLVLQLTATGCWLGGKPPGSPVNPANAKSVQLFNCTHLNDPTQPPSGRSYNVFTRVDGGAWVARGGLNPQPGPWTDCHDDAHQVGSLKLDLATPPGKWEIRAIRLPRADEPQCDSSAPDVVNACSFLTYSYQTDLSASDVTIDVADTAG